ncbi:XRE family transcriptional regulator [Clostridium botulinum]|uniref:XRE family transcriptional regulator n=1 Tax=Clostridium botulinum TaxID=1491 RepID=A0A6M0SSX2_CLOBO|nr:MULTISPECIES: helix-turn-helix transcriptional regulator [Clostridium]MBN1050435.1 XRE family transcriptional regulator [Clostridium botulinum]MCS6133266.1 XRE family transcriptional regulator [Clostridium botulinum]NFA44361.1 XRE family transcriptional regulator [Clostridium botulinum]NFA44370.1 XRE family transcriptional regulator [Clostridium botulinum]NFF82861.1 helix-turn-helix transcriptional regulator [Clostridium botulinum]
MDVKNIISFLRQKRIKMEITQDQMSKYLKCNRKSYWNLEKGLKKLILKDFILICEKLQIKPNEVLKEMNL